MSVKNESIWDQALPGTEESFSAIYRQYFKRLCLYAFQFVKNKRTAEDIVQSSFLKLWKKRLEVDFSYSIGAFLYTVVRNETLDYLRARKHVEVNEKELELLSDDTRLNELIFTETMQQVCLLLNQLPPKCQTISRLLFLEGLDHSEVARQLNLTESTIRTHKANALTFLRQHLPRLLLMIFFM